MWHTKTRSAATPRPPSRAPRSSLILSTGEACALSDLWRDGPLLLVFMPGAFTPVCGNELRTLYDVLPQYSAAGVRILVITCDSPSALLQWQREAADSASASDAVMFASDFWPHGRVASKFGAFNKRTGRALRHSFLLDGSGRVVASFGSRPAQERTQEQFLAALRALEQ